MIKKLIFYLNLCLINLIKKILIATRNCQTIGHLKGLIVIRNSQIKGHLNRIPLKTKRLIIYWKQKNITRKLKPLRRN